MKSRLLVLFVAWIFCAQVSFGAPVVFFDDIPDGRNDFDTRVSNASGTQTNDALSGLVDNTNSWARTGYTITATNNLNRSVSTTALDDPLPGGIPGGDAIQMTAGGATSGLTFTFDNPINAFGIELDDWATCCHPSSLIITFDGGAPITIGTANNANDDPGFATYGVHQTFIGSIDDSSTFTIITLYGNAAGGDVLRAGGIIRYAVVPIGAISGNYVTTAAPTSVSRLASYLDDNDNSGDLQTVATTLNGYSASRVADSLKKVFPVDSVASAHVSSGNINIATSIVNDRIGTVLGGIRTASNFGQEERINKGNSPFNHSVGTDYKTTMQMLSKTDYKVFSQGDQGLWFQGMYGRSRGDQDGQSNGYDTERYGILGGYEFALDDKNLLGFYFNNLYTEVDLYDSAGVTDIKNYLAGIYGQKIVGSLKFAASLGGGIAKYKTVRHVDIGGISGSPRAEYDGYNFSSTFSVSQLWEHNGFNIEPFLLLGYIYNKTQGYDEAEGAPYNMSVSDMSFSQLNIKSGISFEKSFKLKSKTASIALRPYINQVIEVDGSDDANVRFIGSSTQTVLQGRETSITEAGTSLELSYDVSEGLAFKGSVDYTYNKYEEGFAGFLEFSYSF